jgi:lysine 2,3-aminomutase
MKEKEYEPPSSKFDDWHWQVNNSITTRGELEKYLVLTNDEIKYFETYNYHHIKFRVTPYYLSLIKENPVLRKCVIPRIQSLHKDIHEEEEDSLGEEKDSPIKNLVHRYPDRVLLLVSDFCYSNCMYCTRFRMINKKHNIELEEAFQYIERHEEVRDVIVSGGDPLTLNNDKINYILNRLNSINHIEVIRIGTKAPIVLPQRMRDTNLLSILNKYNEKLWINIHVTHPIELTNEVKEACLKLNSIGITLGSQTVLLKDVNDTIEIMKSLMQKLMTCKIRPYYLYMCDQTVGVKYFQSTVEKGLEIMKGLRGWTSGLAIPHFVIDAPKGGGKIPLLPNYYYYEDDYLIGLKNYKGDIYHYYK